MKDKYIKVIVSGLPQSGKTTIAEIIGGCLSDRGFDVTMETDSDDREVPQAAIDAIVKSGTRVLVQEKDAFIKATVERRPKFQPTTQRGRDVFHDQPESRQPRFEAAPQPKEISFSGVDQTIACVGCGTDFVFTVGEQEFFKTKNLDRAPRRCKACLAIKRNKQHGHVHQPG